MTLVATFQRRTTALLTALVASVALLVPLSHAATTAHLDPALLGLHGRVKVIVQSSDPSAATRAVRDAGGTVTRSLPIVGGFAATIPSTAIKGLADVQAIRAITLDARVRVLGAPDPSKLKTVYQQEVNANRVWTSGYTGSGVTVALVDTGIANVPDLAGRVKTVTTDALGLNTAPCMNFSGDPNCNDNYGHGTFVAGIIAGSGASSGGSYSGIAPSANLVSVKIAGANGAADVSNVLAAIQWVVSYKDRYGIKVLNLSLGTDSTQTYQTDPFDYAVEKAWQAGIAVVVSAGNLGPNPQTISKPADDPFVITVGAVDDKGTPGLGDDELPNFSSRGPTAADGLTKPDVVAPGAHIVSLRAPGSAVDQNFTAGIVDANYRRGSGTSFSAGVTSGAVALLLQAHPTWTPDRVKYALMSTANNVASYNPNDVGTGLIDVLGAMNAPAGLANQGVTPGNGLGSLDASRGSVQIQTNDPAGTLLSGTGMTAQLLVFSNLIYVTGQWTPLTWPVSQFAGSGWYGSGWYGSGWYGSGWYGSGWYGQPGGSGWYGSGWYGSGWYGVWG